MSTSLRIAVADDEQDMREFFERMLPRYGHEVVVVAENGRELIDQCCALHPDLIITDFKMPEMDGIQASLKVFRERPAAVILVSAYCDATLIERGEVDHVMAYLVKPIGQADLEPAIAIAVQRFNEMQSLWKEAGELRQLLDDRRIVEVAKGILMNVVDVSEKDAFRRLQELAADTNQQLIDAAHAVLMLKKALRPAES
jgi:response regulator NasT